MQLIYGRRNFWFLFIFFFGNPHQRIFFHCFSERVGGEGGRERGEGRKEGGRSRKRERNINLRKAHWLVAFRMCPNWGWVVKPATCTWLEVKPVTSGCMGWHSNHCPGLFLELYVTILYFYFSICCKIHATLLFLL